MDLTQASEILDTGYLFITKNFQSSIQIVVGSEKDLIEFQRQFGGNVYFSQKYKNWGWNIVGHGVLPILQKLATYLHQKKEHAEVLLEFENYILTRPKKLPYRPIPDDDFRERLIFRNTIIRLNNGAGPDVNEIMRKRQDERETRRKLNEYYQQKRLKEKADAKAMAPPKMAQKKEWSDADQMTLWRKLFELAPKKHLQYGELLLEVQKNFGVGKNVGKRIITESIDKKMIRKSATKQGRLSPYTINILYGDDIENWFKD